MHITCSGTDAHLGGVDGPIVRSMLMPHCLEEQMKMFQLPRLDNKLSFQDNTNIYSRKRHQGLFLLMEAIEEFRCH